MNEKVNKQEFYVKNFDLSLNCFQRHNALTICLVFNDLINNWMENNKSCFINSYGKDTSQKL